MSKSKPKSSQSKPKPSKSNAWVRTDSAAVMVRMDPQVVAWISDCGKRAHLSNSAVVSRLLSGVCELSSAETLADVIDEDVTDWQGWALLVMECLRDAGLLPDAIKRRLRADTLERLHFSMMSGEQPESGVQDDK